MHTEPIREKTRRFLLASAICIAAAFVAVITFLALTMRAQIDETVRSVAESYMAEVNERLDMHFQTIVDFCISRAESVVMEVPPNTTRTYAKENELLTRAAYANGFTEFALLGNDGDLDYICGDPFLSLSQDEIMSALLRGENQVAVGILSSGQEVVLCAVPAKYLMRSGQTSLAAVGVLSDSGIRDMLTLDSASILVTSRIIRTDGDYVLQDNRATSDTGDSYFADVRAQAGTEDREEADKYIAGLTKAMEEGTSYSGFFEFQGQKVRVYASKLEDSQWYLITEMPYGQLNESMNTLGDNWVVLAVMSCALVIAALIFIFLKYKRMSEEQFAQLEVARAEAERANKAKSEFFSSMSHDIRTPMNAIVGMTAIAASRIDNKAAVENCLHKISTSSRQLLGLINDVLDMSKIESGNMILNMDRMSLRELVDSAVAIIQPQIAAHRQNFEVRVSDVAVEDVYCDSVRMSQVLLNLLANAVKFTPEYGTIKLSLREENSPKGEAFIRVILQVADSGIGMSEEFQKVVYESFAREDVKEVRSTEGVGLGMAITKYIVDAMGGTIALRSNLGEGSEFTVTVDLEKAEEDEGQIVLPPIRLLVIDDDTQMSGAAKATLESIGASADTVMDGAAGIEMVEEAQRRGVPYQIVLTDWKLPSMNGIQVARRIHELMGNEVTVLLISAYDWADVEQEAREAGISGFIAKPLFKSTLYHGIRPFLGGSIEEAKTPAESFEGKRLLVAEDNDLNWEIMETILTDHGFEVDRAANGNEAVEKFSLSPRGYYNAILMDVQMPEKNGLEATREIRAMSRGDAGLPIIAMTADAFAEDKKRTADAGMNAHISKPIDIDTMLKVLAQFTGVSGEGTGRTTDR